MDKNLLFAIALSTAIFIIYYTIFPPPKPVNNPPDNITKTHSQTKKIHKVPQAQNVKENNASNLEVLKNNPNRKTIQIKTPLYIAKIDSLDGVLTSLQLNKYKYAIQQHLNVKDWFFSLFTGKDVKIPKIDLNRPVEMIGDLFKNRWPLKVQLNAAAELINFTPDHNKIIVTDAPRILTLTGVLSSGLKIVKKITFYPDRYFVDCAFTIENQSKVFQAIEPEYFLGRGHEPVEIGKKLSPKQAVAYINGDFDTYDADDLTDQPLFQEFKWAGVMDTYFITAVKNSTSKLDVKMLPTPVFWNGEEIQIPQITLLTPSTVNLASSGQYQNNFSLYIGPKKTEDLEKFDITLTTALNLGFLSSLAHLLLAFLRLFQSFVGNWGIAIILLTLAMRLLMFPLALKSMFSMQKMAQLNPKIQVLREKYKNNKERLNKEIMEMYKKQKVNPVGGCLPMIMQIPIFIALYSALLPAIELRHQPFFFWIDDLSAADYTLILPLLMGVTMWMQQKFTPVPATTEASQMAMMKWFPIIMTFFFLDFPAGLVLYWFVNNLISILQQLIFNRIKAKKMS